MNIYCLADLHLSISHPQKDMKVFGPLWEDYHQKIHDHWQACVKKEDLVLIPGDICWAMSLEEAMQDLAFIDKLNGQKVLIRGNHDYWWPSLAKLEKLPFKSLKFIHNNALLIHGVGLCGSRLWDSEEFSFDEYINYRPNPQARPKASFDDAKIFDNEISRLERSISQLSPEAQVKIALCHYPPIGKDLKPTRCSSLFETAGISHVCFGHLHNLKNTMNPWGSSRGVTYHFCAADEVNFTPQKILSL